LLLDDGSPTCSVIEHRKKLIEVALPLDAINKESAREKSIRHGHPSTLHLWWARRPLAACRAVLFASLVDDPSNDLPEEEAKVERDRLFGILEELVKWENSNDENVLGRARAEILRSTGGNPPPVLDPFCGGGSIPLEAQRLGLEAHGSDLNPVAVLITKALIEIPPKFAGQPPINPDSRRSIGHAEGWRGAHGLAEDVRYYGKWMRDEAERRIGHLYPKGPNGETVIAWLWARTVRCPNPACGATMPLVSSFWLSKKQGKKAWVEPVVDREKKEVRFTVKKGDGLPPDPPKVGRGAKFRCLVCEQISEDDHIKAEGKAGRMGQQLMAVVAEAHRGREYLVPTEEHIAAAQKAEPEWRPDQELANDPRNIWCIPYGLTTFADLFTPRQLVALTTLSDLVGETREKVREDAVVAGLPDDIVPLNDGGKGAKAYADAVATYLAFALDKLADLGNSICIWEPVAQCPRNLFGRQAIPMQWNFAEGNPTGDSSGSWAVVLDNLVRNMNATFGVSRHFTPATAAVQDAMTFDSTEHMICTDPPYYDNIAYADLSDFFYVWLRRSLGTVFPATFATLLVPKAQELVATPYRFDGNKKIAQRFFEDGLGKAFNRMRENANSAFPITVYYAFKQSESEITDGATTSASTGWETMLEGLLATGFQITGTWPMRTELTAALKAGFNNLASSIVLVCRPRPTEAPPATRQEFVRALRRELPNALSVMMAENVAPVDLAQATIGPGMAIYSRYSKVVEADGSPMRRHSSTSTPNGTGTLRKHRSRG
jgi:putative DNA methylase